MRLHCPHCASLNSDTICWNCGASLLLLDHEKIKRQINKRRFIVDMLDKDDSILNKVSDFLGIK